jgi:hypothetical protein
MVLITTRECWTNPDSRVCLTALVQGPNESISTNGIAALRTRQKLMRGVTILDANRTRNVCQTGTVTPLSDLSFHASVRHLPGLPTHGRNLQPRLNMDSFITYDEIHKSPDKLRFY